MHQMRVLVGISLMVSQVPDSLHQLILEVNEKDENDCTPLHLALLKGMQISLVIQPCLKLRIKVLCDSSVE